MISETSLPEPLPLDAGSTALFVPNTPAIFSATGVPIAKTAINTAATAYFIHGLNAVAFAFSGCASA